MPLRIQSFPTIGPVGPPANNFRMEDIILCVCFSELRGSQIHQTSWLGLSDAIVLQQSSEQPDAVIEQSEVWDNEATKASISPDDNKEKTLPPWIPFPFLESVQSSSTDSSININESIASSELAVVSSLYTWSNALHGRLA